MANLYIRYYRDLARTESGQIVAVGMEDGQPFDGGKPGEKLTAVDETVQSAAFPNGCRFVRLKFDADCTIEFGKDPSIVEGSLVLSTDDGPEYFGVKPGDKLAFQDSVD